MNPVLREGNSDRRVANAVKQYARKHPHSMGAWSSSSATRVASMTQGDFYGNEQSAVIPKAGTVRIEHTDAAGKTTVLKDGIKVKDNEIISSTVMKRDALRDFYETEMASRQVQQHAAVAAPQGHDDEGLRPDPVRPRRQRVLQGRVRQARRRSSSSSASPRTTASATSTPRSGEPAGGFQKSQVEADLKAAYAARPPLAMVNSAGAGVRAGAGLHLSGARGAVRELPRPGHHHADRAALHDRRAWRRCISPAAR